MDSTLLVWTPDDNSLLVGSSGRPVGLLLGPPTLSPAMQLYRGERPASFEIETGRDDVSLEEPGTLPSFPRNTQGSLRGYPWPDSE